MQTLDGRYTITFNGEIYNFRELRAELEALGRRFRSQSDTEVLIEGYAALGPAVLDRLNGIFAFAIHDRDTGELFLARDPLGVKPLYWAEGRYGVAFASEIKALMRLAPIERDLDVSAIRKYVTFLWCPGEQTLFARVRKLEPGSAMVVRDGAVVRRWAYWTPPAYAPRAGWSVDACAEELRSRLDACVRRQMVSDAPLGAFLSGGLDSSAIVAAARVETPDIRCFTIDTEMEEGAVDDLPFARAVAVHLGVRLEEVRVDARDLCGRVAEMVGRLDEPLADPACLNVLFISELARDQGIKVLLSGAGGDDLFTGYRRHTMLALEPMLTAAPQSLRRAAAAAAAGVAPRSEAARRQVKALSSAELSGDRRISSTFGWGPYGIADRLISAEAKAQGPLDDVYAPLDALLATQGAAPAVEKCLALERRFFLADHNLTYTDKMAMAAGVEVRVPLLDLELVNFAAEVPIGWKHRNLTPKWIFKRSQRPLLPAAVINRPKSGFGGPLRRWMRGDMRDMVEELLSPPVVAGRGLFDPGEVARLREADARGALDGAYTLFSLMCVELWCRAFVDAPSAH